MALQFEITAEQHADLDEAQQALYSQHGEGYRLDVEGIDPKDELKEALRKEREDRAEANRKLQEHETAAEQQERQRLEQQQEWEQLSKQERERAEKLQGQLDDLTRRDAERQREESAMGITGKLARDTARETLLRKEAKQFIHHTPEGIKINGPDGEAWDEKQLGEYLRESYPFLVDGNQSSGGGATGSTGGGAANKAFSEHTGAELSELRQTDPDAYQRLRDQHYNR